MKCSTKNPGLKSPFRTLGARFATVHDPAAPPPTDASLLVLLDGLQSPANAGALLRVAEAAGVDAVGALPGTADLLSPKSLRASAGSAFRLPLFRLDKPGAVARPELTFLVADARGEDDYTALDWKRPCALVLGGEGAGPRPTLLVGLNLRRVRIPMAGKTESLNVAVAAGILLMEARRQRTRPS
jgi:TrmH family RNA methyltransferase